MSTKPVLRKILLEGDDRVQKEILQREWISTNGLGGFASGTVAGGMSRRYHGLLVAALPAPLGRVVMLSNLAEVVVLPNGKRVELCSDAPSGVLREFRLEYRIPIWRYEIDGYLLTKRLLLVHGQNTLQITYSVESAPRTTAVGVKSLVAVPLSG